MAPVRHRGNEPYGSGDATTLKHFVSESKGHPNGVMNFAGLLEDDVNGQICNNCYEKQCVDQFSGLFVDCENVE
jgi:hypothetical protein